jgi:GNAT superfamily N-acetyltransferase
MMNAAVRSEGRIAQLTGPVTAVTWNVRVLSALEWRLLRRARLDALTDAPYAFSSDYRNEAAQTEQDWRRMFDATTWLVALRGPSDVIGLLGSAREPDQPGARHVESIWVAPDHRRGGVLRSLLRVLAERERLSGVGDLALWVLEDNHDARRAYARLGFRSTGEHQLLPGDGRFEERMRLAIA